MIRSEVDRPADMLGSLSSSPIQHLWKRLEFVSWDDESPNNGGK